MKLILIPTEPVVTPPPLGGAADPSGMMALAWVGVDENSRALDALDEAFDLHDPQLVWMQVEPELLGLHEEPRFSGAAAAS